MQVFKRRFKNLKLLLVHADMTDNSTMLFVNLDNFLISIGGIDPGIFLKRLKKIVLLISSVQTMLFIMMECNLHTKWHVRDLCSQSCSVFLHQIFTFSAKLNVSPNN